MGDYGWSMNSDTSQGIVAVEYDRVLEYPKKRNAWYTKLFNLIQYKRFVS